MDAIGIQLRDLTDAVVDNGRSGVSTRIGMSVENERTAATERPNLSRKTNISGANGAREKPWTNRIMVVVVDSHISVLSLCVCFLPIHSGHQVRWTYQPGSHRRKVTQDF